jgi:uncharacterized protein YtpQ (UPF0354 family)
VAEAKAEGIRGLAWKTRTRNRKPPPEADVSANRNLDMSANSAISASWILNESDVYNNSLHTHGDFGLASEREDVLHVRDGSHENDEEDDDEDDVMYFYRSGFVQAANYTPLFWIGDQLVTWDIYDGMQSVLVAFLSGGIGGHSLTHSDIGGFTMV